MNIGLNRTWLSRASVLAGLLPVLLGSIVIIGWYFRLEYLVQVSPEFVPMQFNTALGFLLCGLALLGMIHGKRRLALALGCSVAAIGLITIVEYVFLIDLGVDQLFIEHYITVSTLHAGRMAPNTALCFLLSGLAIVAGVRTYPRRISEHILGLCGGIVAALGLVALLGYASGVEAAYGWGRLTQMAVHTSAGFIIVGSGLSLNALHNGIARRKQIPTWLPFTFGVGVLTLSISMWQALRVGYGNTDSLLPSFVLIAGFLASILLTLTIWLAQTARFREIQTARANEKLRKWELVFQSAGWGVVIIEKETLRLLSVNPAFAKMHGYTLQEAKLLRVADLYPEQRSEVISGRVSSAKDLGHIIYEDDHVRKDGSVFPILANITAICDEQGETLYYAANYQDVTERQRAEKALRESEERYRTVAEDMPVLICLFLPGGEITYVNRAYCEYFEKTPEELVGQTFFSMISKEDRETVIANISALTVETPTRSHEHHVIARGGEIRWQRWTNRALFDAKGQAVSFQSIGEDITESKQAEEALRQSEGYLILAQKTAKIGHYVLDIETGSWTSSAGLDEIFGIDENYKRDVAGWLKIVHPESRETLSTYLQDKVIGKQKKFDKEYKIIEIQTGEEKWVHGLGDLKLDDDNNPVEMFGTIQDVTERVQTEAETARLGTVVEQAAVTVIITDTDGNIVYANPYSEISTGYSVAELVGQNPRILKSGHQHDSFYKELWDTISAGDTWNGVIINKRKDGELYHEETTIFSVKNPDGKIINYAAVQRDISEQVRLNEEREHLLDKIRKQARQEQETQRRIQQQEQLAAVGQLAAGIAHDFNNFMGVILLYAGMLEKASNITSQDQKRLKVISQQARQATDLTQQILDFARRSVLERRPMDLKPFLQEVVKLLEHTVPESIKMVLNYGTLEYIVNADPTRMQQVIMNLTVNARDAMLPDGGELRIELDRVQVGSHKEPPLPEMKAGEWVRVRAVDTGHGIPPDILAHIFEPFFTTKEVGEGTGLGLAQVYGIVKQHGGHIDVMTEVGEGTTFTFYLPALSRSQPDEMPQQTQTFVQGQGEVILVVEDDAILREALTDTLEMLNYRVIQAADGREALDVLERYVGEVSLVLSDVVMPEMGGRALFHELRDRGLTLPVVMLSGHPKEDELEDLQAKGLAGWMLKPPDIDQLSGLLAQVLRDEPG